MNQFSGDLILDIIVIAIGAIAIINGRRFYWAFVGIGGAVLGLWISMWLLSSQSEWIHVLVVLLCGMFGVWLSFRFERIALHFAAFVLGGFILQFLLLDAGYIESRNVGDFVAIMIGGIIGLLFEFYYSNRSLIVFSSFAGAAMIAGIIDVGPAFDAAIFAGLAAVGMLLQAREWIYTGDDPAEELAEELVKDIT